MKNKKFIIINIGLVTFCLLVFFLNSNDIISNFITCMFFLISALYFFPIKFLINNQKSIEVVSDILISFTLCISCLLLFKEINLIAIIFTIINFIFLLCCLFFFSNQVKEKYKTIAILHFVIMIITININ